MLNKIQLLILTFAIINCGELNQILVNGIDVLVDIPNVGKMQGSMTQTSWTKQWIMQFLGIPYAESPSHENRFLPPKPAPKWYNTRDFTKYGRVCPSKDSLDDPFTLEMEEDLEDCLNICVFTKNLTGDFPVMFYIHGGNFQYEDAHLYPPNYLLENDVILVVPQYRIGHLGFASTQSNDIPGNVAVLDVLLALKWTQSNIKYFGGNPNKITIFGQSSGAAITTLLLISPIVPNTLFQRAIFHSGSILQPTVIHSNPIKDSAEICKELDCGQCTEILDINQCLKKANVRQLVNSGVTPQLTLKDKNGILPELPHELAQRTKYTHPIMGGTTKHDGSVIVTSVYDEIRKYGKKLNEISPKLFLQILLRAGCGMTGKSTVELTMKALFDEKDLENKDYDKLWPGLIDAVSMCNYKTPLISFIEFYAQNKSNTSPAYVFTFDYEGEHTRLDLETYNYPFSGGAAHYDDLQYIFPWPVTKLNDKDLEMAKNMVNIWTSFAITGIPTSINGPELVKVDSSSPDVTYFRINDPITIGTSYVNEFSQKTANNSNRIFQLEIFLIYEILMIFIYKLII